MERSLSTTEHQIARPIGAKIKVPKSEPYWLSGAKKQFRSISKPISVDVAIIGGGITGMTAAYLCKKLGLKVAVFERDVIGCGDSGHTTAHLTYVTDLRLGELVNNFGEDHAGAVWDAGRAALEQIHDIVEEEEIDCGLRWLSSFLHRGKGDATKEELTEEWKIASTLGFDSSFHEHTPLFNDAGIEYFHQALFHPVRYLHALAHLVNGGGSHVFESAEAQDFSDKPLGLTVSGVKVSCDTIFVATNTPLQATQSLFSAALFQTKIYPYTSYVIRAELEDGSAPESSYWDTADPYNYLRIDHIGSQKFVICGGKDCKTGQDSLPQKRFIELEQYVRSQFPVRAITHNWLGQIIATNDGVPYIGFVADRCFIGTGYVGNGYTFGTLAGMMLADTLQGRKNPWATLFDPHRKKLKGGAWNYVAENLDYPYYLLKDRLKRTEEISPDTLREGEGRIIRHNGQRVAAFRKNTGEIIFLSPTCTHLGCIVRWNAADSSWDCPCHGSRFAPTGEVRAGPAETPLKRIVN